MRAAADLRDDLAAAAADAGCVAWGVTTAEPWPELAALLRRRASAGFAADMAFTYRNPERSADPTRVLRGAASLFVVAWPIPAPPSTGIDARPVSRNAGRVAAYAARDHAGDLRGALDRLRDVVRAAGARAAITSDGNGLVDREAAVRAGVGVYGRNCNVLVPGVGSWVLLGSVVTDAHLEPTPPTATTESVCGHCRRCLVACPTGALVEPGVLDARRCLAWIVQAPGPIADPLRVEVGDRVYGCDDCQTCCPASSATERSALLGAATDAVSNGVSNAVPDAVSNAVPNGVRVEVRNAVVDAPSGLFVDVHRMWTLDDDELLDRFGHWYIAGRDVRHLRRTLLVVLGNTAAPDDDAVAHLLAEVASQDDALLAEHAHWALARLRERRDETPAGAGRADEVAVRLSSPARGRL